MDAQTLKLAETDGGIYAPTHIGYTFPTQRTIEFSKRSTQHTGTLTCYIADHLYESMSQQHMRIFAKHWGFILMLKQAKICRM